MYAKVFRRKSVMFLNIMFLYFPLVRVLLPHVLHCQRHMQPFVLLQRRQLGPEKWGASLVLFLMISLNSSPFLSTKSLPRSSWLSTRQPFVLSQKGQLGPEMRNLTYFISNFLAQFRFCQLKVHQGPLDYQRDETLMSRKCC